MFIIGCATLFVLAAWAAIAAICGAWRSYEADVMCLLSERSGEHAERYLTWRITPTGSTVLSAAVTQSAARYRLDDWAHSDLAEQRLAA
ncbi:hypothetical protein [Novosphingobium sp. M1R2S20]|uniref:Uncharacterized protein n=1 Tax=Novosphingobium rhizovicinum TaxID=3228928 RepID=A0ABV3RBQ9_9SPHN